MFDGPMLILALALAVFVGGFACAACAYFRNDPLKDATDRLAVILSPAAAGGTATGSVGDTASPGMNEAAVSHGFGIPISHDMGDSHARP